MAQRLKTDWILFTTVVLMVLFGALMIYSASSVVADMRMGASYYFAVRQLIWTAMLLRARRRQRVPTGFDRSAQRPGAWQRRRGSMANPPSHRGRYSTG